MTNQNTYLTIIISSIAIFIIIAASNINILSQEGIVKSDTPLNEIAEVNVYESHAVANFGPGPAQGIGATNPVEKETVYYEQLSNNIIKIITILSGLFFIIAMLAIRKLKKENISSTSLIKDKKAIEFKRKTHA